MAKYTVMRADNLTGTKDPAHLISALVYDDAGKGIEVENGSVIEATELVEGERELFNAKLATASSKKENCYIVATPEVMYDERKRNLSEFINEPGQPVMAYDPVTNNTYSVTAEGFVGGTVPKLNGEIGLGAGGKLDASKTGWGTCIDIEVKSRYTYYTIKLA